MDGYLTTAGQAHRDAAAMIEALGFEVEDPPVLMAGAASPLARREEERRNG